MHCKVPFPYLKVIFLELKKVLNENPCLITSIMKMFSKAQFAILVESILIETIARTTKYHYHFPTFTEFQEITFEKW